MLIAAKMRFLLAITAFCLSAAGEFARADTPATTLADGRTGRITFSVAAGNSELSTLVNRSYDVSDTIWGDLLMPEGVNGVVPAMVISHGSGGVEMLSYAWAEMFAGMGVATFVIDHFSGRGKSSDQITVSVTAADGLMALRLLTTHPRIDASRIGYIGFSRGGSGALLSGFETMRAAILPNATRFALHLPFYPGGWFTANNLTGAPMRVFMGDLDDSTVEQVRAVVDHLRAAGGDVEMTVYPGAYHAFDAAYAPRWNASAQSSKNCYDCFNIDIDTRIAFDWRTGSPITDLNYLKTCRALSGFGTWKGNNASARSQARQSVWSFVRQQFGLTGLPEAVTLPGDTERILSWAEFTFRSLLGNRTPMRQAGGYTFRCYATNGACAGTRDGTVYYYDGVDVKAVGSISSLLTSASADGM